MMYEMSEMVINRVLPTTETDDIVGVNCINQVKQWFYLPTFNPIQLAMLHKEGVIPTIIQADGVTFIGTKMTEGVTEDIKRIAKMFENDGGDA